VVYLCLGHLASEIVNQTRKNRENWLTVSNCVVTKSTWRHLAAGRLSHRKFNIFVVDAFIRPPVGLTCTVDCDDGKSGFCFPSLKSSTELIYTLEYEET